MKSSFNAFGTSGQNYGQLHQPVWLGVVTPVPVGGTLYGDYLLEGLLLGAGFPVNLTNKVIKPFFGWKVVAFSAGDGDTTPNDTITVKPLVLGKATVLPGVGDKIMKVGSTFEATGKAAAVVSVTLLTEGDNAGCYAVAVAHSATVDTPSAGDVIALSSAASAGSSKSLAIKPNGYLYNDICLGDIDVAEGKYANATGAVVMYHPEGLLIDLTASAEVKSQMKSAVPGVLQV